MGDCKSQMKKSTSSSKPATKTEKKGIFGRLAGKSKKKDSDDNREQIADTFADHVDQAQQKLTKLLSIKTEDLKNESGREDYNRRALGKLETMNFHLDQIIDLASDYGQDL